MTCGARQVVHTIDVLVVEPQGGKDIGASEGISSSLLVRRATSLDLIQRGASVLQVFHLLHRFRHLDLDLKVLLKILWMALEGFGGSFWVVSQAQEPDLLGFLTEIGH